jgi:hypothetical protein
MSLQCPPGLTKRASQYPSCARSIVAAEAVEEVLLAPDPVPVAEAEEVAAVVPDAGRLERAGSVV